MTISDISQPSGLKPQAKYFAEVGDTCINADGCIEIMRQTDTPQAKAIYFAFRKRLAEFRSSMHGTKPEKIREEALFTALNDVGFSVSFTPIRGTMD
jgi:hypothetical protein